VGRAAVFHPETLEGSVVSTRITRFVDVSKGADVRVGFGVFCRAIPSWACLLFRAGSRVNGTALALGIVEDVPVSCSRFVRTFLNPRRKRMRDDDGW
jgi:hypothetical protein